MLPVTGTNVANADVFKSSVRADMLGGSITSCTSRGSKRHAAEWTAVGTLPLPEGLTVIPAEIPLLGVNALNKGCLRGGRAAAGRYRLALLRGFGRASTRWICPRWTGTKASTI